MTVYEQDFIYKVIPNLTKSIENLTETINNNNINPFYKALDDADMTQEKFFKYIGAILNKNVDKDTDKDRILIEESWDFIKKLYDIASECLHRKEINYDRS